MEELSVAMIWDDVEVYRYLGVLEADDIMHDQEPITWHDEVKRSMKKEYIRRAKKSLSSKLNAGKVIKAIIIHQTHYEKSDWSRALQTEYKKRNDVVGWVIHWEVCKESGVEYNDKWYEHSPKSVQENEEVKLLWDFTIQTGRP